MMGILPTIKVKMESGERDIIVSPFLFSPKELPNLQTGKVSILYFYNLFPIPVTFDEAWKSTGFKFNNDEKNYFQDFEKYYLGSFNVDMEAKRYWQWEGNLNKLSERDVEALAESLFNAKL